MESFFFKIPLPCWLFLKKLQYSYKLLNIYASPVLQHSYWKKVSHENLFKEFNSYIEVFRPIFQNYELVNLLTFSLALKRAQQRLIPLGIGIFIK